jgi:hypothetical protein
MNKQSLKGQLKLYLIDYFDGVKFEIDIQAQKLLEEFEDEELEDEELVDKQLEDEDSEGEEDEELEDKSFTRKDVLKMNLDMLDKVKEIYEKNSKAVDDYFDSRDQVETNDLEELKDIIFNGFCVFYSKKDNFWLDRTLLLGMLIVTDWYLD